MWWWFGGMRLGTAQTSPTRSESTVPTRGAALVAWWVSGHPGTKGSRACGTPGPRARSASTHELARRESNPARTAPVGCALAMVLLLFAHARAGVFATEPGHQIPTALLPDGHPIRGQVTAAMLYLHDDPGAELPKPGSGWIEADGAHVLRAPLLRAAILQQLDGQGAVLATHYRGPDQAGFDWVVPVAGSSVATSNLGGTRATVERTPPRGVGASSAVARALRRIADHVGSALRARRRWARRVRCTAGS
ncbi:hypothetical protein LBMAG42_28570 [Deltaproteobacteria bacterium]|nr:hypothetical protein LBMAG42_28570 [Deltaproteobacteria bacterium]